MIYLCLAKYILETLYQLCHIIECTSCSVYVSPGSGYISSLRVRGRKTDFGGQSGFVGQDPPPFGWYVVRRSRVCCEVAESTWKLDFYG